MKNSDEKVNIRAFCNVRKRYLGGRDYSPFLEYYRKIHYLTREFHVKLLAKTDIARIAKR